MAADADGTGEFARIRRYLRPLAGGHAAAQGLIDDGACLPPEAGAGWAVTTDTLVAGVHFRSDDPPDSLALKLLGVNLSDLAAMAAEPAFYTLNLSLSAACDTAWWQRFAAGLAQGQAVHGLTLLGGDTTASPGPTTLSATLFGRAAGTGAPGRGRLQVGDRLWVTGTIGDAALGLKLLTGSLSAEAAGLSESQARYLVDRYRHPRPRWQLGRALGPWVHGAIDISDGLMADLGHLAAASGVGIDIAAGDVPLSPAAAQASAAGAAGWPSLLTGGDDYELVVAAPAAAAPALRALAATHGVGLACIGTVVSGSRPTCYDDAGDEIIFSALGWDHMDPAR